MAKISQIISLLIMCFVSACAVTPVPFTDEETAKRALQDRKALFDNVERVAAPISLAESIARTLRSNLEKRVKLMEEALSLNQLDLDTYDMLPKAVAGAGYLSRDSPNASSSANYITGVQTLSPSVSTDQQRRTADLGLSWNILDFGVSYFSAKQNANRALMAAERRRKTVQLAVQDVISAYWRTVAMQAISAEVALAKRQAEVAITQSNVVEQESVRSPLEALRFQRSVLESLRHLETVEQELAVAQVELGALMNLPPGVSFTVAAPSPGKFPIPKWVMPVDEMEMFSLQNNPDLRDSAYQGRIAVDETRKAIVRMLPGFTIAATPSYDSNSFLIYKNWTDAAARVSWNLFSLLSGPANVSFSKSAESLAGMKRLALSMAVLTQTHIALRQYESALQQFDRATTIADVEQRTYQVLAARGADELGRYGETIAARAAAIAADLRRYQAYAQVHMAIGRIRATLGMDFLAGDVTSVNLAALTRTIEIALDSWMDGTTPVIPPAPSATPATTQPISAPSAGKPTTTETEAPQSSATFQRAASWLQ